MSSSKISYFCIGMNTFGQLGVGNIERDPSKHHVPIEFGNSGTDSSIIKHSDISDIQCGGQFTVVLLNNGKVIYVYLQFSLFILFNSH